MSIRRQGATHHTCNSLETDVLEARQGHPSGQILAVVGSCRHGRSVLWGCGPHGGRCDGCVSCGTSACSGSWVRPIAMRLGAVLARLDVITAEVASREHAVSFVSEVIETPDGPMALMDANGLTNHELRQVLDSLLRAADELGLESGTVEVPPTGRLVNELGDLRLAVVGSVLPPPDPATVMPPKVLPNAWCDVAASWLRQAAFEPLVVEVLGVEAEIGWGQPEHYLHASLGAGFRVSCGSVGAGLRTVVGNSGGHTRLAFMAAGLSWSPEQLEREANDMCDRARGCAPDAAYAYVTPISKMTYFGGGEYDVPGGPGRYPKGGGQQLRRLCDVMALDAFWYQLLGQGHLERTGPISEATLLSDGKAELLLGEFDDWLDEAQRMRPALNRVSAAEGIFNDGAAAITQAAEPELCAPHQRGRTILEPCFMSRQEARALWLHRLGLA